MPGVVNGLETPTYGPCQFDELGLIGLALAVAPDFDALIDRDQMEMQVEYRLAGRRLIVLHHPHAVGTGGRLLAPGQPWQLRRHLGQRLGSCIEQIPRGRLG